MLSRNPFLPNFLRAFLNPPNEDHTRTLRVLEELLFWHLQNYLEYVIPYGIKEKTPQNERSVGIRHNFETQRTTISCRSLNHSVYSVSVRWPHEKLERKKINSYTTFPVLGSEGYEVGLPSVVARPGLFCLALAPALKSPCLVVRHQDNAPPSCLNLHSRDNQLLTLQRDTVQEGTLFFTILTSLAYTGFTRE